METITLADYIRYGFLAVIGLLLVAMLVALLRQARDIGELKGELLGTNRRNDDVNNNLADRTDNVNHSLIERIDNLPDAWTDLKAAWKAWKPPSRPLVARSAKSKAW